MVDKRGRTITSVLSYGLCSRKFKYRGASHKVTWTWLTTLDKWSCRRWRMVADIFALLIIFAEESTE